MDIHKKRGREIWETTFEMIEDATKQHISEHVRNIIFKKWYNTKSIYFSYLNENFRKEVNIFEGNEKITYKDICGLLDLWEEESAQKLFENKKKYKPLLSFLPAMDFIRNIYRDMLSLDEILSGRIIEPKKIENIPEINEGIKISKFIKKLIEKKHERTDPLFLYYKEKNKELIIELILDFYSQIYSSIANSNSTIVLSINPIDLLMVSNHTVGNWSSCYNFISAPSGYVNWRVSGYANNFSERTFVAYAYDKEAEFKIKNSEFNKILPLKRWRQMIYIDVPTGSAYFSHQYPQSSPLFSKYARKLTGTLLADMKNSEYAWKLMDYYDRCDITSEEEKDNKLSFYFKSYHGYQDDCLYAIALNDKGEFINKNIKIDNPNIPCIKCGKIRNDTNNDYFCPECA